MKNNNLQSFLTFTKGCTLFFLFIACRAPKKVLENKFTNVTDQIVTPKSNLIDSLLKNAHVGISVFDVANNKYLNSYQADKYFIPASNLKIATCYSALKYLGDSIAGLNYLEDDSTIQIQGTGDPSFLNPKFANQQVFQWLKSKSSKKIYLLNTNFKTSAYANGWSADDYLEPYMAERNGFPIYENIVIFNNKNGIQTEPKYFQKLISQSFEASNGDDKFKVKREIGTNNFLLSPGKNNTKKISFTTYAENEILSNRLTAQLLTDTLQQSVYSKPIYIKNNLKTLYSQRLDDVLKEMMTNSNNFIAEQLLLMMSDKLFNEMNENKLIQFVLNNDLNSLPQTPKWVDGSGLSRYNLITPEDFVFILNTLKKEIDWERIKNIFPKSNEGTLKGMFTNYSNNIFAKSGTLSNNYSLSGYLIANSGKEFTFSIMVNNHMLKTAEVKKAIEEYLTDIINNN